MERCVRVGSFVLRRRANRLGCRKLGVRGRKRAGLRSGRRRDFERKPGARECCVYISAAGRALHSVPTKDGFQLLPICDPSSRPCPRFTSFVKFTVSSNLYGDGGVMRIFIQPPNVEDPLDGLTLHACEVLRGSRLFSARPGGIVNGSAVVLVNPLEMADALVALKSVGLQAFSD